MSFMKIEDIKKTIPHREPFLFVDEIIKIDNEKIIGVKKIKEDEFYFKGHFPNNALVPGVLLLEMIAQVGAVSILNKEEFKGKTPIFTGVKNAKFKTFVKPDDNLVIEASLTKLRGSFGRAEGIIYVNDEVACEAEISFAIF